MRRFLPPWVVLVSLIASVCHGVAAGSRTPSQPNILFILADDLSARLIGSYGEKSIKTPAVDRIAREGVRFTRAYCAAPSCTPSRSALLTGQAPYRLQEGGILMSALPAKFDVFPLMLERAGYQIGYTGKGWAPGNIKAGGRTRDPVGIPYQKRTVESRRTRHGGKPVSDILTSDYAANFEDFLKERTAGKPFYFWCGFIEPHLTYPTNAGVQAGKVLADASVPGFLPDHPRVREDLIDGLAEIEYMDSHIGRMLRMLEERGELDSTLIVFTSDHGMPFPRSKCTLYDVGTHVPLAVRYPTWIRPGRVVEDLVSLVDLTPTFLEAANVAVPDAMTGRSLKNMLKARASGSIDASRDFVITSFERHTWARPDGVGYPMRAIRTRDFLYIRNYEPDRWPMGDPDFVSPHQGTIGDSDWCPTKDLLIQQKDNPKIAPFYQLAYGKRPSEELYHVSRDPDTLVNLASSSRHQKTLKKLREKMEKELRRTEDPRMRGEAEWEGYPYYFKDYSKKAKFSPNTAITP